MATVATKKQSPAAYGPVATLGAQGSPLLAKWFSVDLPQASAAKVEGVDGNDLVLPKGALVLGVQTLGGGTGGSSPTVDIGDGTDADFFANELAVDAAAVMANPNTPALNTALTEDKTVYVIDGGTGTPATGGTFAGVIYYMYDAALLPDLSGT